MNVKIFYAERLTVLIKLLQLRMLYVCTYVLRIILQYLLLFSNSEARGQGCKKIQCLKFRMGCSLLRGENKGSWTPVEVHQLLVAFLAIYIYIHTVDSENP